ncbi:MAG: pilus assembly protein PilM [Desulfobulbaceae bacterium A2]|nr:MAG: pilus assembly protein PilM [Desulfobulbaceae bacterium A2]
MSSSKEPLLVGLDIGSHTVKVCQLRPGKDGLELMALGNTVLPIDAVEDGRIQDDAAVGEAISRLFRNLKISERRVGVSVSGYSVIVKKISTEILSEQDLAAHIPTVAEQYIPFDIKDVYLDYQDLHTISADKQRTDVLLIAAKKEIIDGYLQLLERLRLKPMLVDVDSFALENIYELTSGAAENVALVDIGASTININIIAGGNSLLARDIVAGSRQITELIARRLGIDEAEAERLKLGLVPPGEHQKEIEEMYLGTCTQWILEIKKNLDLYRAKNAANPVQKIVLSGGGSRVQGLEGFIKQETGLEVSHVNPFANIRFNPKKLDEDYVRNLAPEMAIAAGLAIRPARW